MERHSLDVLIEAGPDGLDHAVDLLRRHGLRVESLTLAPSHHPGLNRLTALVQAPGGAGVLRQIERLVSARRRPPAPPASVPVRPREAEPRVPYQWQADGAGHHEGA